MVGELDQGNTRAKYQMHRILRVVTLRRANGGTVARCTDHVPMVLYTVVSYTPIDIIVNTQHGCRRLTGRGFVPADIRELQLPEQSR